jgi:photosystem II stability/assembly factor-like uncharacterized protein
MTPSVATSQRVMRLLLVVALLAAVTPMAHAQLPDVGGSWLDIDVVGAAGLPTRTDATLPGSLFFFTPTDGVRGIYSDTDSTLVTTDGGVTWRAHAFQQFVPAGALADGFAWLRTGATSDDFGRTWSRPAVPFLDYTAVTRTHHVAISQPLPSPGHLLITSDGGSTWSPLDVAAATPAGDSVLTGSIFGAMPAPAAMESTILSWQRIVSARADEVIAISSASGTIDGASSIWYYLVTLDLAARTIRSIELPMYRDRGVGFVIAPRPLAAVLTPSTILIGDHEYDRYFNESRFIRLWRSEDGGATWQKHDTLVWFDEPSVKFFSPTFGVSTTAKTTDGGRTWQHHGRPFGSQFFALDSARWFVADTHMLTGRTTDGGRTWTRSHSSAPFRSIVAHRGNVAIARSQRSVLVSSDRGATWSDVGRGAEMPDDLSIIAAMTWLDTLGSPGHIIGVGGFVDERGARTARMVASTDFGRTWTERGRLPMLDQAIFRNDLIDVPLVFQTATVGEGEARVLFVGGSFGLAASDDDGLTFQMRSSEMPIHGLAMIGAQSGVAMSGNWDDATVSFYSTGDGGRTWRRTYTSPESFVYPAGFTLTDLGYRALVTSFSAGHREWVALSSVDGEQWSQRRGSHDGPPLKGGDVFWSERDRFHVVGRGASILYSGDGGSSMAVHHDAEPRFVHALPTDSTADLLFRPLISARDGRDIYVADYFRNTGRWTIGDDVLDAPIAVATQGLDARLLVARDLSSARLEVDADDRPQVWLVDMRGMRRSVELVSQTSGRHGAHIDLRPLPPGAYLLRVGSARGAVTIPLVVTR